MCMYVPMKSGYNNCKFFLFFFLSSFSSFSSFSSLSSFFVFSSSIKVHVSYNSCLKVFLLLFQIERSSVKSSLVLSLYTHTYYTRIYRRHLMPILSIIPIEYCNTS